MFFALTAFVQVFLSVEKEQLKMQADFGMLSIQRYEFPICDPAFTHDYPQCRGVDYNAVPYSEWCVMSFVDEPSTGTSIMPSQNPPKPFVNNTSILDKVNEIEPILDTNQARNVLEGNWEVGKSIRDADCLSVGVAESYMVSPLWFSKTTPVNETPEKRLALKVEAARLLKRALRYERGPDHAVRQSIAYVALANMALNVYDHSTFKDQESLYRQAIKSAGRSYPYIGLAADLWMVALFDASGDKARAQAERDAALDRYAALKNWRNYLSLSRELG